MSEEKKAAAARYHRKTLLETADRLLMQYGYDGMNMNMLAKEAGYSKATVYVYLESKDEIVRLLCIERLKLLRKEFSVILKNGDTQDDMFAAIGGVLDEFVAEDRTYFDFICSCAYASVADPEATASQKELSALVSGIMDDLSALAPKDKLAEMWYNYYGRIKTAKMFGFDD